jgi:uridine phosphorylase
MRHHRIMQDPHQDATDSSRQGEPSPAHTFPNFAGKHNHESLVTPQQSLLAAEQEGLPALQVPEAVIFFYQASLWRRILAREDSQPVEGLYRDRLCLLDETDGKVGVVGNFGFGAPVSVVLMEGLVAGGTRRIVSIGAAGSLQHRCRLGDLVIATCAIRDEGVSHHYLAPGKYSYPSEALSCRLKASLDHMGLGYAEGTTWTIDAPYRETVEEARHYQAEGVLCVEMEAAALFAVGSYRGVEVAAGFVVSDSLADQEWTPWFRSQEVRESLDRLLQAAITACS